MMNFNRPRGMAGMFYDGGKGPGDPKRATMSEQAIVDRGKDDVGHFVVYETAGGDRVRVSVPDGFEPKNNEQYDIVDFGEGFKVEFKDATDREASAPGDQFGPSDPPGQRGDMFDQGGVMQEQGPGGLLPIGEGEVLKDNDGREYVVFENPKGEGTIKVYSDNYGWNEVHGIAQREAQGMGKFTSIPMDMEYPVNFNTETGEYELNAQMYEDQMSKQMEKKTQGFRGSIKRELQSPGSTITDTTPKGANVEGLLQQLGRLEKQKANKGMRVLKY